MAQAPKCKSCGKEHWGGCVCGVETSGGKTHVVRRDDVVITKGGPVDIPKPTPRLDALSLKVDELVLAVSSLSVQVASILARLDSANPLEEHPKMKPKKPRKEGSRADYMAKWRAKRNQMPY